MPTIAPPGSTAVDPAVTFCYQAFGLRIESDCALPELIPEARETPGITVRSLSAREARSLSALRPGRWPDGGDRFQCLARIHQEHLLVRFPGTAMFQVSPGCTEIRYCREPLSTGADFRHVLLDQVLPRALAHSGHLVLHASSVIIGPGAVCCIGHSGSGKSTLAAAFHSQGMRLLADDTLLIDATSTGICCAPAYPGVRLWPDAAGHFSPAPESRQPVGHHTEKLRCRLDPGAPLPAYPRTIPVRAILALRRQPADSPAGRVELTRLSGAAAAGELLAHAIKVDVGSRVHLSRILRLSAGVAAQVPVYLATYPSDLELLPRVCTEIASAIDRG